MALPSMTLAPGGHVCAVAGHGRERAGLTAAWVRDGLDSGERVVWIEGPGGDLFDFLRAHDLEWEAPLARGQLQVAAPEATVGLGSAADIPGRIAQARELAESAVADGYAALRLGVEIAVALTVMPDVATQLRFERAWEDFTRAHRASLLCLYDPQRYGTAVEHAIAAHPRGLADGTALATVDPAGVHLAGELDLCNVEVFADFLESADGSGDLVIDLSGLSFIDVRGAARLIALSRTLGDGKRLRVVSPPRLLTRILDAVGWTDELDIVEGQHA